MTQELGAEQPGGHGDGRGLELDVDRLVADMIGGQPAFRQAYLRDARTHHEAKLLAKTLRAVDEAMMREGIGRPVRERVIARALYGGSLTPQEEAAAREQAVALAREQAERLENREELLRQFRLYSDAGHVV
ncbi:hypothetical protein ACGFJC_47675 [Nonomuraea fuscirosea]|uniref:hypothetical protein n=1 Tax=Nonomuraea fuscirosea TaxID=1291556 RepID=UPI00371341C5